MFWPPFVFNLCVGLLLAAYLLRAVRRFERTADRIMTKIDQWHAEELRKYDVTRDDIRASMRVQIDAAIVEMEAKTDGRSQSATSRDVTIALTCIGMQAAAGSLTATVSSPVSDQLPTEEEIRELPRWVQVAFAARCARRVVGLLPELWPLMSADDLNTLEKHLTHVEGVASSGELDPTVSAGFRLGAAAAAHHVAATAHSQGEEAATAIAFAIAAAMYAAYKDTVTEHSYGAVRSAGVVPVSFDTQVQITPDIRHDFETIRTLALANGWTNDTSVSPSVFGPLWPEGPPEGWPKLEQPVTQLVFEFDVPDDMTTTAAIDFAKELSAALCELHLAGGGHGLAIQPPVELTAPVRVRVPV